MLCPAAPPRLASYTIIRDDENGSSVGQYTLLWIPATSIATAVGLTLYSRKASFCGGASVGTSSFWHQTLQRIVGRPLRPSRSSGADDISLKGAGSNGSNSSTTAMEGLEGLLEREGGYEGGLSDVLSGPSGARTSINGTNGDGGF